VPSRITLSTGRTVDVKQDLEDVDERLGPTNHFPGPLRPFSRTNDKVIFVHPNHVVCAEKVPPRKPRKPPGAGGLPGR
jgi:hypothetical protein